MVCARAHAGQSAGQGPAGQPEDRHFPYVSGTRCFARRGAVLAVECAQSERVCAGLSFLSHNLFECECRKYRFYFEEYTNQRDAFRVWWSTEATNNEYDVPKSTADCLDPRTPKEDCTHTIKSVFKGRDFVTSETAGGVVGNIERLGGWYQLIYAAFHCHAPACISVSAQVGRHPHSLLECVSCILT
jgi:hypothetical protein